MKPIFFNKKLTISVFIFLIVFSVLPKPAFAYVLPVAEINPLMAIIEPAKSIITAVSTTGHWVELIAQWIFKMANEIIKRQLLNMIVDQIVVWIQGGGEPKFKSW